MVGQLLPQFILDCHKKGKKILYHDIRGLVFRYVSFRPKHLRGMKTCPVNLKVFSNEVLFQKSLSMVNALP